MSQMGPTNWQQVMSGALAEIVGTVAASPAPTTDSFTVAGGTITTNIAGASVIVTESTGWTVASIVSNTGNALTFAASTFTTAPTAGASVKIYMQNVINATVTAPDNIAQIGGWTVPGNPIGSVGSSAPAAAMQMAASDGTNSQTLASDAFGRLTPQPPALVWDASGYAVGVATNVFATGYTPTNTGTVTLTIGNDATGASSVASLVKTANTAPSGGSAGTRIFALNGGTALGAGDVYTFTFAATPNNTHNLQFATATTVDITALFDQR